MGLLSVLPIKLQDLPKLKMQLDGTLEGVHSVLNPNVAAVMIRAHDGTLYMIRFSGAGKYTTLTAAKEPFPDLIASERDARVL